ncbi:hypothetical protein MPTK1_2g15890 [Marchantia polymorpha subsp. ruderalis]|uniref:Cytochrome b561 and DOMON domain-containing protein n=2 Tax=Marchantia polymorpha TaxID=3197 RepID=A0A176VJ91_MARPO|nr:hypothetical protein AXG93_3932s1150 [Marchantia polymorpha subsp. ruderalis]PTQ34257.1 hypothetical protein MARPO_0082s0084 [Marchantia polymorpha]BBN02509.1 hypothetical protein Mp_2g15890 [Marchantia polymorpha subsp. ruderalis]|eukprot:PTQ34257.1 hypothetical protein MARPO_0082s0084 [Marchantia polymorpha]
MMRSLLRASPLALLLLLILCVAPASAQTVCPVMLTSLNGTVKTYAMCTDLQNQGCTLSWSFLPTGALQGGGILDVAFRTTLTGARGWAAWGINLELARSMVGTNALIAFNATNGTNVLPYKLPSNLRNPSPPLLAASPIDLEVLSSHADIVPTTLETTIYASIRLPANLTTLNQVWNRGPAVAGFSPLIHDQTAATLSAYGTLDVSTGAVTAGTVANEDLKNNHGIVNVVAWGILFPVGIMSTRYIRPFTESIWFYMHVSCQVLGYVLGVIGFGMGIKLQQDSGAIRYKHRNLGVVMFALATLQVLALVLRPKPEHKLRKPWNVYHHSVGYTVLILSIINIFEGFDILMPDKKYKHAYVGVIIALGAIAVVMEIITWAVWIRNRSRSPPERLDAGKTPNGQSTDDLKGPTYDGQL